MTDNKSIREKLLVRYKNETYDLSTFIHKHPGGKNTLNTAFHSDIDHKFDKIIPHSDAAKYLINEYKISNVMNNNDKLLVDDLDSNAMNGSIETNSSSIKNIDESMEHLVDWSRGMVAQISYLGANYTEWVNKPVDRPLRLFDTNALEMLTKTPWWLVPCFWLPIMVYLIRIGIYDARSMNHNNAYIVFQVIIGIVLWTLIEYSLHRWVFHLDAKNRNRYVCTFHFLLHGLHHKVPFDPYRLVFPPFPATILATLIYQPLSILLDDPKLIFVGGLIGYLCYDMMHYYIHHGCPTNGYFYNMKRYHYQHHFVHHDKGFGISSSVWDEAFGTKLVLRKLRYLLKW